MLAYIDASVLIRIVFNEPGPLKEMNGFSQGVSSELIKVECLRILDRYKIINNLSEDEFLTRIELIHFSLKRIELLEINSEVLNRASQAFPTSLGTLDAIHLSTCLLYQQREVKDVTLCTHDEGLKKAAKALGLPVLG
jgi:predicted nucleic acid-binding protein